MAVTPYDRITNLQNDQALAPTDPYPAQKLDQEYNALKVTTDDIIQHLDLIQRDDGQLENDSVGIDQLRDEVLIGFNAPTPWETDHDYIVGDTVFQDNSFWFCEIAHLSGVFIDDQTAGKWSLIANFTDAATVGARMYIGDNPPAFPAPGQQWYESDTGNTFVYVDDGTSQQWVHSNGAAGSTAGGVAGPASAVVGNIAFWNDTGAAELGAAPAYHAGNPGNAALYSHAPNATPLNVANNMMQVSLGTPVPAGQQWGYNLAASPTQQAIVGTVSIAAGDVETYQANAVAGYAITSQPPGAINTVAVGILGQAATTVPGANVFGGNVLAYNSDAGAPGAIQNPGFDANFIAGFEADVNIFKKADGSEPTIGNVFGIGVAGGGTSTTDRGDAVNVNMLGIASGARWANAFRTFPGAAVVGINLGQVQTGPSKGSQTIRLNGTNASGVQKTARIEADLNGSLYLSAEAGGLVALRDIATTFVYCAPGFGGANIKLPSLTATGVLVNAANGDVSSSNSLALSTTPAQPHMKTTTVVNVGASSNIIITGNNAGFLCVREANTTGDWLVAFLGTFAGGTVLAQGGAAWTAGFSTTPGANLYSVGYDAVNNQWKIFTGSGNTGRGFAWSFWQLS